jgi:hypothetical protein
MLASPPSPTPEGDTRISFSRGSFPETEEHAKYDLTLTGAEETNGLQLTVGGAGTRFKLETVAAIAEDLEELTRRAAEDPEAPISRLLPRMRYHGARVAVPSPA